MTCCASCLVLVLAVAMVSCAPTVRVSKSRFVGVDLEASQTNKPYHAYYAIPFAEPPVGDLRFKAPVAYNNKRQRQNFDAQNYTRACVQGRNPFSMPDESGEDCLYLNVFTPSVGDATTFDSDINALKKVIVYIYGGAFSNGDTSIYRFSTLVTEYDVIVVTTAYRFGPLGFLSSGDKVLPGNLGLLDQITALEWVKDNIRKFGGDPTDVTIYGTSAGAVSVGLLSLSPMTKGLFTKVIMESGSPLAPWAIDMKSKDTFFKLAVNAECLPTGSDARGTSEEYNEKIVNCLRDVDADELGRLLDNETIATREDALSMESSVFFGPVVDGVTIPRDPFELLEDAAYLESVGALDRTYMVGVTNNEAMTFVLQNLELAPTEAFLNPDSPEAKAMINNNFRSVHSCPITEEILHIVSFLYYYPRNTDGVSSFQSSADFMSDVDYVVPAVKFVRALTEASTDIIVYLNLFDYHPEVALPGFQFQGSFHGFGTVLLLDDPYSSLAFFPFFTFPANSFSSMRKTYMTMVTNMAKEGDPSIPDSVEWPCYDRENENYMAICETPEVRRQLYARRVAMWDDFLPNVLGSNFTRGTSHAPRSLI